MRLDLPFPPSTNHYYRHVGAKTLISSEGRHYREVVQTLVAAMAVHEPIEGLLRVEIIARPPDHRRRDLDNLLKGLLDSLEHAHIYWNDSQIADLRIMRAKPRSPGSVEISICAIDGVETPW